ncbi:MAG: SAM-dependent methyltransferase [Bacteroidia bacterium]|nr:SAM-dependent methyltransferase [Bacteroidia bacterium]
MNGIFFLVPSLLNYDVPEIIPTVVTDVINSTDNFIVEDEKSARHFLKVAGLKKTFQELSFRVLNEHTDRKDVANLITPLLEGKDIILLSEAGCPAIADPGSELVRIAHQKNITVRPVAGASSIFMALMASGMNGQQFIFHGYLPKERSERIKKIKECEQYVLKINYTQIFIEAPHRNNHLLEDLLKECSDDTLLCIASAITGKNEFIKSKSISEWKKIVPELHKIPTVFLLGR